MYSCCNSTRSGLMSCSNPTFQPSNDQCPTSPKLSNSSIQEMQPRGSLESDDVYITEHLLRTFSGVSGRPEFFFRSFQAGFSVNIREPSNSMCGCNRTSEDILDFISDNDTCPSQVYYIVQYASTMCIMVVLSYFFTVEFRNCKC